MVAEPAAYVPAPVLAPVPNAIPAAVSTAPAPKQGRHNTKRSRKAAQEEHAAAEPVTHPGTKGTRRRRARLARSPRAVVQAPNVPGPTFRPLPSRLAAIHVQEYLLDALPKPVISPTIVPVPKEVKDSALNIRRRLGSSITPDVVERPDQQVAKKCLVYSFNVRMKELARKKNLNACLKLIEEMRTDGAVPDKYTYSTILACCARVGAVDVAMDLFDNMKADRVPCDDYIRTNLLTVAANSSPPRIDLCTRVFRTTNRPSRIMCNVLMDAYARAARVEECLSTFRYMALRSLRADRYTVSALIKAYVKAGRLDEAVEKIHEMHSAGLEVTSVAFGQVMDAYGKMGAMDNAVRVFDLMTLYGVEHTQVTYNILIGACAYVMQTERAFEIFEEMKATSSFPGDRYTFHSLMKCRLSTLDGQGAIGLYRSIKRAPFPCNQVSYRLALTGAGQAMDVDAIHEIVEDISNHNSTPREDTAATMVAAALRCSDLESGLKFFSDYLQRQTQEAKVVRFLASIRDVLRSFERENAVNPDFEHTTLVVDELERSWRRGL